MYRALSTSVAAEAAGEAAAEAEPGAAEAGGAADAAALGEVVVPPLGVHAAMKALRPAMPAPARNPRRCTRVVAMRCISRARSRSRSWSAMSVALLLPVVPGCSKPQPT